MPERPRHRRRFLRHLLTFLVLVIAIRFLSPVVANGFAAWLVVADPIEHADAAVALSGADGERLLACIELYKQGIAKKVLIVGPDVPLLKVYTEEDGLTQGEAKRRIALRRGVAEEDILVELRASSTYDEAITVREVATRESWDEVCIVTSPLHTRRARATFRKVLAGSGVAVEMHHLPIGRSSQNPRDWWRREGDMVAVATETFKMAFYAYRYRIYPWS